MEPNAIEILTERIEEIRQTIKDLPKTLSMSVYPSVFFSAEGNLSHTLKINEEILAGLKKR